MVVSYTNNNFYPDAYANRPVNNISVNADGGGNGGGGAFFKMFEEKEAEEIKKDTSVSSNPLDDLYPQNQGFYASDSVIKDYIDNSLLLNTEQVACTNITQHLALKSNVKETLKFLNTQAAKTMVDSKKRNYKYQSEPRTENILPMKNQAQRLSKGANFFETGVDSNNVNNPHINFFITKTR